MTVDSAATFLVGSLLVSLGFIIIVLALVVVNNIIAKYWKPIKLWYYEYRYMDYPQDVKDKLKAEKTEPKLDPVAEKQQDKK